MVQKQQAWDGSHSEKLSKYRWKAHQLDIKACNFYPKLIAH